VRPNLVLLVPEIVSSLVEGLEPHSAAWSQTRHVRSEVIGGEQPVRVFVEETTSIIFMELCSVVLVSNVEARLVEGLKLHEIIIASSHIPGSRLFFASGDLLDVDKSFLVVEEVAWVVVGF
jgi:hypothetical protein